MYIPQLIAMTTAARLMPARVRGRRARDARYAQLRITSSSTATKRADQTTRCARISIGPAGASRFQ
jgi:hypothetical protein